MVADARFPLAPVANRPKPSASGKASCCAWPTDAVAPAMQTDSVPAARARWRRDLTRFSPAAAHPKRRLVIPSNRIDLSRFGLEKVQFFCHFRAIFCENRPPLELIAAPGASASSS
jgi:hypothetical protein